MRSVLQLLRLLVPLSAVVITLIAGGSRSDQTGTGRARSESPPASRRPRSVVDETARWQAHLERHPGLSRHRDTLLKLSARLPFEDFSALSPALQQRLAAFAERRLDPGIVPAAICWEPGVSSEVIAAFHAVEEMEADSPTDIAAATQFDDTDGWGRNATFTSFFERPAQGKPTTLTWSFIPDGTSIFGFNGEPTSPSDLIAFLDARYRVSNGGSDLTTRPWFPVFQAAFDNIASLTGITYVYEPRDDGADLTQNSLPSGRLNRRGDIRIGGHFIDGESGSNTLAYNFQPPTGDMIIDTGNPSFYGNLTSDSLNLRNVVEHEHGHGLGLNHVCPVNQTKLMEPFISRLFRGLQLDDIFSLNRLYGDFYEGENSDRNNDSPANASALQVSPANPFHREFLSIDDNSDVDYFRLDNLPAGAFLSCQIIPVETPVGFVEGPQNTDGSCSTGTPFDFTHVHDLSLDLLAANGSSVLVSSDANPAGQPEEILSHPSGTGGTFYLRVAGDSTNSTQLYTLEIEISLNPPAPTNLAVAPTEDSSVRLTWTDNSNEETGFVIERKSEADGTWLPYDTTAPDAESYLDANPVPGTNLYYRVVAQGAGADSSPSNEVVAMTVDLLADSYLYDAGGPASPLAGDALRLSSATAGEVSWSGAIDFTDQGTPDAANRDYLFATRVLTLSHRILDGFWQVTLRQGDATTIRDQMAVAAEGVLQVENVTSQPGEYRESVFVVEVLDGQLDLTFTDLGGSNDQWVLNRLQLVKLTPYQAWAQEKALPSDSSAPGDDADGDGLVNVQEYFFGLEPLVPQSTHPITSSLSPDGSRYHFTFDRDPAAQPGTVSYQISDDLRSWSLFNPGPDEISISPNGDLETVVIALPVTGTGRYLRVGITLSD